MMKLWLSLLCLFSISADEPSPWQTLFQKDLHFTKQTLLENTPNAIDEDNPQFYQWLTVNPSLVVNSIDGYFAAMQYYLSGFKDPHVDFQPHYEPDYFKWPGFVVRFDGQKWRIAHAEPCSGLSIGEEVVSADQHLLSDLMTERVFPYHPLDARWAASMQILSPQLFLDRGNPFLKPLRTVQLSTSQGIKEIELNWINIRPVDWGKMAISSRPWSIKSFLQGAWVEMPYFSVKTSQQQREIETIIDQLPKERAKPYLVLDLRGNRGGQSFWGTKVLKALYGDEFIEERLTSSSHDLWRASPDNLKTLKEKYLPFLKTTTGDQSPEVEYIEESIRNMTGKTGLIYAKLKTVPNQKGTPPLFKGKLLVITNSDCASSCLTFLKEVLNMPHVVHLGQPTTGDSPYVEQRKTELPSGLGVIFFPMKKVSLDKENYFKPYLPEKEFKGDIMDTPALETWVEKQLTP